MPEETQLLNIFLTVVLYVCLFKKPVETMGALMVMLVSVSLC